MIKIYLVISAIIVGLYNIDLKTVEKEEKIHYLLPIALSVKNLGTSPEIAPKMKKDYTIMVEDALYVDLLDI